MVALPERVLHGAVQGRDFDYFYGPLSLWVPALAYRVLGVSLGVERAVGAAYLALLGSALYVVGRRWSWWIGLSMALIAVGLGGLSLSALPVTGALALLVVALCGGGDLRADDVDERGRRRGRRRSRWVCGRTSRCGRSCSWRCSKLVRLVRPVVWVAFAVGLAPYLVVVARAGWGPTFRTIVGDGAKVGAERRLHWHFAVNAPNLVVGAALALIVAALALSLWRRRGGDPSRRARALLGLGVIGLCLVPEFVQRTDQFHTLLVVLVPFASVPALVAEGLDALGVRARRPVLAEVAAIGAAAVVLFGISPKLALEPTLRDLRHLPTGGVAHAVSNRGRTWYYLDPKVAAGRTTIVEAADKLPSKGRTLFVGTADLARTSYVDLSFYTLLPQFEQDGHFYDFHPRVALDYGRRLADDVRNADVLVLCDVVLHEPNLSRRRGSEEANAVVRRDFVPVASASGCTLYQRAAGAGTS